ncbi:hypothetical protein [Winogradskyella poriferorum]|jgi:hypothetical protein|uniref:hypothetical protein n=1 Tax=Winogradskyella poriferorum TaxID=307627 RepID=UPI003D653CEA
MKNWVIILLLFLFSFGYAQQNKELTLDSLKLELAKFLVKKKQLKNLELYTEKKQGLNFRGIHNFSTVEKLENGIYTFSNFSSHRLVFFLIVEDNTFHILDVFSIDDLKVSVDKTLEFCLKQKYCTEIISDYITRLFRAHYTENMTWKRNDSGCKFERKRTKSVFNLMKLKIKLANYFLNQKVIENINTDYLYESIFVEDLYSMYYGVDEEKEIDCGIYSFLYLHDDDYSENVYYVIVNEDWIEFIAIDSKQEISKSIQMIIDFSVNHKYCYLKTTQIIDKLLKMRETNSCLKNAAFKLP